MRIVVPKEWIAAELEWAQSIVDELAVMLPRDRHGEIIVDTKSPSYLKMAEGQGLIDAGHSFMIFMSRTKKKHRNRRKDDGQLWLFPETDRRS